MSGNESAAYALQIVGFKFYVSMAVPIILECVIILVVNPFACFVIIKNPVLRRSPTNIFIISTCVSDVMYSISLILYESSVFEGLENHTGIAVGLCNRIAYVFTTLSMMGSMLTTMFIAIERSIATYRPLKYRQWVTPKRAVVVISITWVYLLTVVPGFAIDAYLSLDATEKRILASNAQEAYPPKVFRFYISMHIYLSLLVSIIAYTCISYAIFKQVKNKALMTGKSKDARYHRQSLRVTKMSMLLLGLLLLTWAPFAVTNMIIKFPDYHTERQKFKIHRSIAHSTVTLLSAYSYLNIIVYCANHSDFKRIIQETLGIKSNRIFSMSDQTESGSTTTTTN
ncbi:hypothetical protein CAPTEDRAFT_193146 [Capitella teleta]|uniref:G-protein coupled receptors family 1 profile domain-containing protein n=1 Tax=Capitella teleta TaxID=283909 RepID=R7UWK3_CAPTE|nr:hypothetical protein CAPTEDRAFT_193146 [Capitella teleta]|eukprot:ELU07776.1 hypothetical protein CAPTEDRAFT_193146 [Capitella teleta]